MSLILNGTDGISDVDGSAATPAIRGTDTNTGIFFPAADTIAFSEGGTEVARFDSAGNFGIGTASPDNKLLVAGSLGVLNDNLQFRRTGQTTWNMTNFASNLYFNNGSDRMVIDSSGNVLVGKTSASDAVVGTWIAPSGMVGATMASSTSAASTLNIYSTGASAYRFYVTMDGKIACTSTTIAAISDVRLKENIEDIDVGLDAVMALKPRKFDWKDGKGKDIKGDKGWIAQEFEQIFPEMISTWKDEPPEGEEPYKAVAADLIPVLVKAIQELKAELDSVKAELAALKA
jgi:hypothetical protein